MARSRSAWRTRGGLIRLSPDLYRQYGRFLKLHGRPDSLLERKTFLRDWVRAYQYRKDGIHYRKRR